MISFIIPAYNSGSNLQRTVRSIQAQWHLDDYEILVVDNNSTDDSVESVRHLERVRILNEREQGASAARNRGIEVAEGPLLVFVDSDVELARDWVAVCKKEFEENWVDCVQTPIEPVGKFGSFMLLYRRRIIESKTLGSYSYLVHAEAHLPLVNSSAFMIRKSAIGKKRFDSGLKRCEDFDFSLQLFAMGCHLKFVTGTRAFVSDDRNLVGYLWRSLKNGFYTELIRKLWRFETPARGHLKLKFDPLLLADRLAFSIGAFVGSFFHFKSELDRSISDHPHRIGKIDLALSAKARIVDLGDRVVLFELERGKSRVLRNSEREQLLDFFKSAPLPLRLKTELTSSGYLMNDG